MKKIIAILLAILMASPVLAGVALADETTVNAYAGADAYIDANGAAHLVEADGTDTLLPLEKALRIVAVTDKGVLALTDPTGESAYWLALAEKGAANAVTIDACGGEAVYVADHNAVYYLSGSDLQQLMKLDLSTLATTPVMQLAEPGCTLYAGIDGLCVTAPKADGTYETSLYEPETNSLHPSRLTDGAIWQNFGAFETQILPEGGLELRVKGQVDWQLVTGDAVSAVTALNNRVYFLCTNETSAILRVYDLTAGLLSSAYMFNAPVQNVLTAGDNLLFAIDAAGTVTAINPETMTAEKTWTTAAVNAALQVCVNKLLVYGVTDLNTALLESIELTAAPTATPAATATPAP